MLKTFMLLYVFTFGGVEANTIEAEGIRLRATPEMCQRISVEQEDAVMKDIEASGTIFTGVRVYCQEVDDSRTAF